ncbi:HGGxSTG domain-containing protein [Erwinia psidii]|uniref:Uncharacterized protein n=2 Tax=Erwinia psidii TaxID=69224 RepID=A0A3N6UWQ2_9GAMM|nr:HGGxSTG domain-containing protein [Erwinia psidii]RQM37275.1 hypothetical protein EB241_16570 [Erwinia psidii]
MNNKEKVRLLMLHREVGRRNYEAFGQYHLRRESDERESYFARFRLGKRVRYIRPEEPEYEPYPDIRGLTCGARTRKGTPCKNRELSLNGRCKFHGGKSTGAKTKAGRKRQREGHQA